jgi:hypothetical protein
MRKSGGGMALEHVAEVPEYRRISEVLREGWKAQFLSEK